MATFGATVERNSSDIPVEVPIAFTGCFDDYNVTSCVRFVYLSNTMTYVASVYFASTCTVRSE
jgi:hypothetical protein